MYDQGFNMYCFNMYHTINSHYLACDDEHLCSDHNYFNKAFTPNKQKYCETGSIAVYYLPFF